MSVTISAELEKVPCWKETRDYLNNRLKEEALEGSVFIRQATPEEEIQLQKSGKKMLLFKREEGALELAVACGKYLDFEEIKEESIKFCLAPEKSILLHLWLAQMTCLGNYYGGCDS